MSDPSSRAESEAETAERLLHGSSFGAAAAAYAAALQLYSDQAKRSKRAPVTPGLVLNGPPGR